MAHYTVAQLYAAARKAGFTPTQAVTATAISLAENGSMDPYASHRNSNGTYDHGAWQINDVNRDVIAKRGNVNDLQANANMAHDIYERQGWNAWTTYKDGAYRSHLPTATKTAQQHTTDWKDIAVGVLSPALGVGSALTGTSPIGNVVSSAEAVGNLANHLVDPALWKRVGIAALAVVLLMFAVAMMVLGNKNTRGLVESAGKVAAL